MVIIDYGSSSAKVLVVNESDLSISSLEFPLGFATLPHLTVPQSIDSILEACPPKPWRRGVFASGEIAGSGLGKQLTKPPLDPVEALNVLGEPIVDVGAAFTYILGEVTRMEVSVENVASWLPFEIDLLELADYLANKKIYCQVVPATPRDLAIEQAIAREKIRSVGATCGSPAGAAHRAPTVMDEPSSISLTGAVFSKAPHPAQAVLMALDGLQPQGQLALKLDKCQILPALGTLKHFKPKIYERARRTAPLLMTNLGTTISVPGPLGAVLDFGLENIQEVQIAEDSLALFPLKEEEKAEVGIKTAGGGERSRTMEFEAFGGEVGLVIDARARPLPRPKISGEGRDRIRAWDKALGAHGQIKEI